MKISKKIVKPEVTEVEINKLTEEEVKNILSPVYQNQGYRINLGHKHENLKRNLYRYFNIIGESNEIVSLLNTFPKENYQVDEILFSLSFPEKINKAIIFKIDDYS